MDENIVIENLLKEVPELEYFKSVSGILTIDFDSLGAYINQLARDVFQNKNLDSKRVMIRSFSFLNDFFDQNDKDIYNLIAVSIFETLPNTKFGYSIAQKYMSNEMYQCFLSEFPYEENKDAWDTSTYYSDEEYQRILNLPDVEDGNGSN